jgi:8-hydroxy-5-deazaflavin:NADPH oxidoreductase
VSTAIIGAGNIGRTIAEHFVAGGEHVILAAREPPEALAEELGGLASAAPVPEAIRTADVTIFAVWFDVMKSLVAQNQDPLVGKVVVDPSNPVAADEKGEFHRTLPEGVSAGAVIAGLLPADAHFVKAFGTLSAGSLKAAANRTPRRAVLFYATDDPQAQKVIERLISVSGFDPVRAGGVEAAIRIEMYGDLHQFGGLNGELVDADEARAAIAGRGQHHVHGGRLRCLGR